MTATSIKTTRQPITPELRQWIVDQAQTGHAPQAVLKAMVDAGWNEDVAIAAMEATLEHHLAAQKTPQTSAQTSPQPTLPPQLQVPEPALADAPLSIDAGDRRVAILQVMHEPRVVVFGSLLSDDECDALIAAARPRLQRSLTVETKTGGEELHPDRTSDGMFFTRGESEIISRIEARIARLVNWPLERGEGLQILCYGPGAEYKPHYDYFDPEEPGTPTIVQRGGQRVGTLIMYLSEPVKGGATVFPDLRLDVSPIRGNAVFFSYDRPHPVTRTLHGGAPVLEGEKWIATKWLRERRFD